MSESEIQKQSRDKVESPLKLGLETRLIEAFGATFERAPWPVCRRSGAWIGRLFYAALRKRRQIAIDNIRMALGVSEARANQLARRSIQNFGITFCEFLRLRVATEAEIREQCLETGVEHIFEGLAKKRGVILLTGHLGNWELLGARAALEFPVTVVARPTSNGGVQERIDAVRAAAGLEVISKYDPGRAALQALRQNRTLAILPDQHAGHDAPLLPFFGRPTRFIPAVSRLALMSGATIVPSFGFRRAPWLSDGRINGTMMPPIPLDDLRALPRSEREAAVIEGTKRVIGVLEDAIRSHPDQWLWMHRRWRKQDENAVVAAGVETLPEAL